MKFSALRKTLGTKLTGVRCEYVRPHSGIVPRAVGHYVNSDRPANRSETNGRIHPFNRNGECLNVLTFFSLNTKRRLLYLKTQSVPRCKHFSSRL